MNGQQVSSLIFLGKLVFSCKIQSIIYYLPSLAPNPSRYKYCLFLVFYHLSWFAAVFQILIIINLLICKKCRAEFELGQIALFCNQKQSWRNLVLGESAMAQIWCRRCATMDHQHQPKASKTPKQHNRPLVFDQEHPVLTKLFFFKEKRAKTKWNFWQLQFFQQVCTKV